MYCITVISKHKNAIAKTLQFFNKLNNKPNLNLNVIKKCYQKKHKKKIISVLKSPHVNKTAQEQFEFNFISKQFLIKPTTKNLKFLLSLKKVKSSLFPDTKILIKLISNQKIKKQNYKIFKLNNFNLKQKSDVTKKIPTILNMFDIYGEVINIK